MPGEVFISYSRRDKEFVRRLHDALKGAGRDAWVDWEDIPLTADWWLEICAGIEAADSFVFIISPDSVRSATCFREIDYATQHNKRMMPILCREITEETDTQRLHPAVNAHNWIFFREMDNFDTAFKALIEALDTDLSYVREHTRLLVRARSWENRQRDRSQLLTGTELVAAEAWLDQGLQKTRYQPSDLHIDFIRESRRAQNRRQRRTQVITAVVSVILLLLVASLVLFFRAEDARREAADNAEAAERQGQISQAIGLAAQAQLELFGPQPERGILLGLEALENYPYVWQADRALGAAVQTSRARRIFDPGAQDVSSTAFSSDGLFAATASNDTDERVYTAQIWDIQSGEARLAMIGHTEPITSIAWSPDGAYLLTGGRDRTARLWLTDTGDPLATLTGHQDWVLDVAWSPDGTRIVTTGADDTALVWDAEQVIANALIQQTEIMSQAANQPLLTLTGHTNWVTAAGWSPDSTRIVTASRDGSARTWDVATGEPVATLDGQGTEISSAAFSPDGARIVTTQNNSDQLVFIVTVWDAPSGSRMVEMRGHTNTITSAAWSPDGSWLVTASADRTIRVWEWTTGDQVFSASGHNGGVNSVDWSPDSTLILTGGADGTARTWDARISDERLRLVHEKSVNGAAWDASGGRLLTWSADNTARVWDVASGGEVLTLTHEGVVNGAAWSRDETRLLTWSVDGTARVWDAASGGELLSILHNRPVTAAAWSPDAARMATAATSREAVIWDAATGLEVLRLTGHTDLIRSITYSADGTRILTTGSDNDPVVRVWEAATGALLLTITGHGEGVNSAAWSPDETRILTASDDDSARVWDAATGAPLLIIVGHTDDVMGAAWSPDGTRVLTASLDRSARVWDANTGSELLDIEEHNGGVTGAAWSPDGRFSVTSSRDTMARVWNTWQNTGDLIAFARGCCVVRELTPDERRQFELPVE